MFPSSGSENIYTNFSNDENGNDTFTSDVYNLSATDSVPHPDITLPYSVLLGIAIYLTVIGILATFGNVLFVLTVMRWRYLRNNSHMLLLLNMAAADLAISITGYPYTTISGYIGKWVFGTTMCTMYAFLCFTFSQVSMNTLVAVSIFRYIAICHPHMKHFLTSRMSLWALAVVWGHALFWTVAPLVGWSSYTFEPTRISCSFDWNDRTVGGVAYVIGTTLFCYVSHIAILTWCYRKIFQTVSSRQSRSRMRNTNFRNRPKRNITTTTIDSALSESKTENEGACGNRSVEISDDFTDSPQHLPRCQSLIVFSFTTENLSDMELHVLWMNVAMIVCFLTFWTPYAIISCISAFYDKLSPVWYIFPTIFAKTSCMINPILYGLTNSFLRKQLLLVLRGFLGLTSEIEDFQVMRQRQQDGLYNKEGIFVGKKKAGATSFCTCEGCLAPRRQMTILIERAGISPAVSSAMLRDEDRKDNVISNGAGGTTEIVKSLEDCDSSNEVDKKKEDESYNSGNWHAETITIETSTMVNEFEIMEVERNAPELKGEISAKGVTEAGIHEIPRKSVILNVNTLPNDVLDGG